MSDPGHSPDLPEIPAVARVDGVEECSAVINGIRWRYQHAGSGPALLLIHGFMAYSFSWRFVIKELAQHYSVYAVDLPNTGFSGRDARLPGTLLSDAEHLLSFMDHLGIDQCDILGTSRGGGATIALAGLLAERGQLNRIRRVVLSAPINPWSRYENRRVRFLRTRPGRIYVVQLAPRFPIILKNFFTELYADQATIPPGSFAGYQSGLKPPGSYEHIWNIARSWTNDLQLVETTLPLLESLPALILWGDRDAAVRPGSAYDLHHRWNNSAVLMMQNIGHMPYEEAPDDFNRIVLDFLLRDTPTTSTEAGAAAIMQPAMGISKP